MLKHRNYTSPRFETHSEKPMSDAPELSKIEHLKAGSRQLRGTIAEELLLPDAPFTEGMEQLLKNHGTYQQENRDGRGTGEAKAYGMMVRSRVPGGKVTTAQFLSELDLCDRFGNGTLRITTRQGFQLHGVLKGNLRETIREINRIKLTTLAACGDVNRNVMCCPAPLNGNSIRRDIQDLSDRIAEHLRPRTGAYFDLWLRDEQTGIEENVADFQPVEEPIYGANYLPRKFKIGVSLPEDNCVDVLTYDLGFVAIHNGETIEGYNVYVGGGQGITPANKKTFATVAKRMAFCLPEEAVEVAGAVVKAFRDTGNRSDRKQARLKYVVANHGLDFFRGKVEEHLGHKLAEAREVEISGVDDHMGWHEQGDGNLFLGINIENGRIKDDGALRIKSGLRAILGKYGMNTRLTALQGVILCDIRPQDRADISKMLTEYGIAPAEELTLIRRYSIACPALPTCGLSVTESERVMPRVIDDLEAELRKYDLIGERISVHMTGCPNGCARPYTPDIGLVGKSRGKYTVYLGGNAEGTRLAFLFRDQVPLEEIAQSVSSLLPYFKKERHPQESFGDFCYRKGLADLQAQNGTN
ncbi:MAG: NADPH-dependent assimilatory sulfite reductase hemoprotein subunit [Planctomycetaceae bacterium]